MQQVVSEVAVAKQSGLRLLAPQILAGGENGMKTNKHFDKDGFEDQCSKFLVVRFRTTRPGL
jgi:hypothetical protein